MVQQQSLLDRIFVHSIWRFHPCVKPDRGLEWGRHSSSLRRDFKLWWKGTDFMRSVLVLLLCSFATSVGLGRANKESLEPFSCDPSSHEYAVVRNAVLKGQEAKLMKLSDSSAPVFQCLLDEHDPHLTTKVVYAAPFVNSASLAEKLGNEEKRFQWSRIKGTPVAAVVPHWQVLFTAHLLDTLTSSSDACPLDQVIGLAIPLALSLDPDAHVTYVRLRDVGLGQCRQKCPGFSDELHVADALQQKREVIARTPVSAVDAYAPFLDPGEISRSEIHQFARNTKGDRVLVKVHVDNGPLMERWYNVVLHRTSRGWEYESVWMTAIS